VVGGAPAFAIDGAGAGAVIVDLAVAVAVVLAVLEHVPSNLRQQSLKLD
jgi:hypothetical protein